jgi:hypothetical protein
MRHNLIFVEFKYFFIFIHEMKMSKLTNFGSTKSPLTFFKKKKKSINLKYIKIKNMSINKKYIKIVGDNQKLRYEMFMIMHNNIDL